MSKTIWRSRTLLVCHILLIFQIRRKSLYYRPKSLRRVCFYRCLSVCPGGVRGQVHLSGRYIPQEGTPPGRYPPKAGAPPKQVPPPGRYTPGQVHPLAVTPPGRYPLAHSACWDTVNNRAVRIPLECILVSKKNRWAPVLL